MSFVACPPAFVIAATASRWTCALPHHPPQPDADHKNNDHPPHAEAQESSPGTRDGFGLIGHAGLWRPEGATARRWDQYIRSRCELRDDRWIGLSSPGDPTGPIQAGSTGIRSTVDLQVRQSLLKSFHASVGDLSALE